MGMCIAMVRQPGSDGQLLLSTVTRPARQRTKGMILVTSPYGRFLKEPEYRLGPNLFSAAGAVFRCGRGGPRHPPQTQRSEF